ncbi:MAG: hypothetical protein KIT36_06865 [Alphaproteobacteria bacterium]|nr:hypothetical protein [Alphaproteobacteria bacterium]
MHRTNPMLSRRTALGLVALSAAASACTTTSTSTEPGSSGTWTQTADGRVVVTDPGVFGYSVMIPAGWAASPGAPGNAAAQVSPRDGGAAVEVGIVRLVAGETPERAAMRVAQRIAPTSESSRAPTALAPIPLRSGGGRRAQVYSIPQRGTERVIVVALIGESGAWAYQVLYAASRDAYDRNMPLMRNIVASYRRA